MRRLNAAVESQVLEQIAAHGRLQCGVMAHNMPKLVRKLCFGHEAWIVGSAVVESKPRDWDVAVPFSEWRQAAMLIPESATPNTMGGWKCDNVDVWPCELSKLLRNEMTQHLWHPRSGAKYKRCEP